tara:strand:+ start:610 stop:1662 length:1053 start_codon:yes stop_codon:yes gene_type:complete
MVQKILDNEIINKYKINRCIPTIPKKKINNNLTGGFLIGDNPDADNVLNLMFGWPWFWYRLNLYIILIAIAGFFIYKNYGQGLTFLFVAFCIFGISIDWYYRVYKFTELSKKDTLQDKILYFILGSDAKIKTFHKIIFFSVLIFVVFIIINISIILLIKLLEGDKDTCLKNLRLSRLRPLNILPDNSETTRDYYNNRGVGQGPVKNGQHTNLTVDKDYFDLNNFIKPFIIRKENTVSQDAGIIFNPNNIDVPGQVNPAPAAAAGANAALINIGQGNNNQGSIFDNRIKVVEKDIYQENEYFKANPLRLTQKLKEYFQYIYDKTSKRHFIAFEIKKDDVVNTPYGNILASQ